MAPKTMKQWRVQGTSGFDCLKFDSQAPVPEVGDKEVLVKFNASSLNYRDLCISKGFYPFPVSDNIVPGSDGAGVVEAVGKKVTRFRPGDRVVTLFHQEHFGGSLDPHSIQTAIGGLLPGTQREYGTFDEQGLLQSPKNLNDIETSTLTCAALTSWNALYGLKQLKPGEYVLTQGTGGVSIFAVQFAKAAGAKVIATTSSAKKAELLKKLGADHIINYKEDPNWGETAKKLTPNQVGVDHVIEVGGATTLKQSLNCIKLDGIISLIGFVGGNSKEPEPSFLEALAHVCTVRAVFVGSRLQMEEMIRAIEANDIHPVVDEKVFTLGQLKEAYQYMWDQKHFGKLCIKI
ncbi:zinc-binding alcohol dehydrogenase-like protein [Trichodelitschia bisporula]|uniref:Zinc-binding alcohol dehydrogenase-like protein n=1 Tax=Trichodelitschia bisporula TaxID=703511 RepID=A0A6G1HKM2_9PEZI|nr:zinc-binding alcohol dehydrogenase-like protein [Trichodelitschia bisporula]